MAIIRSGSSSALLTVDPSNNAARVVIYDGSGSAVSTIGDKSSLSQTLSAFNASTSITLNGQAGLAIQTVGSTGSFTLSFEATVDNSNWFPITGLNVSSGLLASSTTFDGAWIFSIASFTAVRARISTWVAGGSVIVSMRASPGTQISEVANSVLPTGAALDSTVSTRLAETTFTARINTLGQKAMNASTPVVLASDQSAIPVSGTITSNIGTTGGLALDATLTGGNIKTKIWDGTNSAPVISSGVGNNALSVLQTSAAGSITSVNGINTETQLLASNPNRRGVIIFNDTTSAVLKIGLSSATVSATNFTISLSAGGSYEIHYGYTGEIRGVWSISEGAARITEFS